MFCLCDGVLFGDPTPQPLLQTEENWIFLSPSSVCFIHFIILVAIPSVLSEVVLYLPLGQDVKTAHSSQDASA